MIKSLTSFDIWDTCLTRAVREPQYVFLEVALDMTVASDYENSNTADLAMIRARAAWSFPAMLEIALNVADR